MIQRIQRKRTAGFRLPPNTVCITRPGKLGNPFDWRELVGVGAESWAKNKAVNLLRNAIDYPQRFSHKVIPTRQQICEALEGKDFVACWCALDEPCHGDLYIRIASGGPRA
jgi:hypothetical protein